MQASTSSPRAYHFASRLIYPALLLLLREVCADTS